VEAVVALIQRIQEKMVLLVVVGNGMERHQEFLVDLEMFQQHLHLKVMQAVLEILLETAEVVVVAVQVMQEAQDQEQILVAVQVVMESDQVYLEHQQPMLEVVEDQVTSQVIPQELVVLADQVVVEQADKHLLLQQQEQQELVVAVVEMTTEMQVALAAVASSFSKPGPQHAMESKHSLHLDHSQFHQV